MGVALPRPQGDPTTLTTILNFFIDHKLLDGGGILKKNQTLIVAKNWYGPVTPLRVTKHRFKSSENFY